MQELFHTIRGGTFQACTPFTATSRTLATFVFLAMMYTDPELSVIYKT